MSKIRRLEEEFAQRVEQADIDAYRAVKAGTATEVQLRRVFLTDVGAVLQHLLILTKPTLFTLRATEPVLVDDGVAVGLNLEMRSPPLPFDSGRWNIRFLLVGGMVTRVENVALPERADLPRIAAFKDVMTPLASVDDAWVEQSVEDFIAQILEFYAPSNR